MQMHMINVGFVCVCRYVSISSLSFSPDGQFLCVSSNTETVHIFKLEQLQAKYAHTHRQIDKTT